MPTVYLDRLRPLMLNASGVVDNENRLWYHAMAACLDDVVGNVTCKCSRSLCVFCRSSKKAAAQTR